MQGIGRAPSQVEHAGVLDGCPAAAAAFVAVRPVGPEAPVRPSIHQLEAATSSVGPVSPLATRAIMNFIDRGKRDPQAGAIGNRFGPFQHQAFTAAREVTLKITHAVGRVQVRINGAQPRRFAGHHQITASRNLRSRRKIKLHAAGDPPTGQVDGVAAHIVQFDELQVVVVRQRIIHQFVEHDAGRLGQGIESAGSRTGKGVIIIRSIRGSSV